MNKEISLSRQPDKHRVAQKDVVITGVFYTMKMNNFKSFNSHWRRKMDMNEAMKTNQSFHLSLINVLTARGNVRNIH